MGKSRAIGIVRYDASGENCREVDMLIGMSVEWKTSHPPLPVVQIEGGTVRSLLPGQWLIKHESKQFTILTHEELLRIVNACSAMADPEGEIARLRRIEEAAREYIDQGEYPQCPYTITLRALLHDALGEEV